MGMKHGILVASLLILTLVVAPAGAFSADGLLILVDEDGDADITFDYTLSWIERIAVFFKIAEPEQELKSALEEASGAPVTVTSAKSNVAEFSVLGFTKVQNTDDGVVYSTPALDLTGAQAMLDRYWFAPLMQPTSRRRRLWSGSRMATRRLSPARAPSRHSRTRSRELDQISFFALWGPRS